MSDTVSSKEALFMLDEDMTQEMESYKEEVTKTAIKFINKTPELYKRMKATKDQGASLEITAKWWAEEARHNQEFGDLLITELESVDWDKVSRTI